jgi:hypothetical protein
MDHRWDESTLADRAAQEERERFGTSQIARDPDVERRDRMLMEERQRSINLSPWEIGEAWYDQRDLFTRSPSIEADGYGIGPSTHPEDGSYAYHREPMHADDAHPEWHATIYEREAWPWLNYKDPEEDPYFSHLHEHEGEVREQAPSGGWWQRLTAAAKRFVERPRLDSKEAQELARTLERDVVHALAARRDLDSRDITPSVRRRDVTLEGTVSDKKSKHAAEEIAAAVPRVRKVHNRLTIAHDDTGDADVAFALPLASMGF